MNFTGSGPFPLFLFLLSASCLSVGCGPASSSATMEISEQLSVTVGSRQVLASVPVPASLVVRGNTAVLTSGRHVFVIESSRVVLDGADVIQLPVDAKVVGFYTGADGQLTINTDFGKLLDSPFPK